MPTPTPSDLELLIARKARHGQLGLGERQRGEIGIVAHVGDDAGDDRGLAGLVLAHRGVLGQHMRHLVAEHGGQFRRIARQRKKTARDIELAVRQREGVHRAGIEDRDPVTLIGAVGRCDQAVDGLGDERFEPGVVICAAVARQDALVLLFGGGGLRDGRLRLGHCDGRGRRRGLETGPYRRNRRGLNPARGIAQPALPAGGGVHLVRAVLAPHSRRLTRAWPFLGPYPCRLVCAQQLDLSHEAYIDTRPRIPLSPAPDTNTLIFQRLKGDPGAFERGYHAL
ncbi:hypothetical protein ACVWXL_007023 [Bradyrhizobium sp. GM22.5]